MPFDWITFIILQRMNTKPHTEQAKAKMRLSHAEVSQRPEILKARSEGGLISWFDDKRESHAKAISEGIRKKSEKDRQEQEKRNEINRARVAQYLERVSK